jgi:hypothetical protein
MNLAPRMRHFSNSYGFRDRVARLLIPISGEMIWLPKLDVLRTYKLALARC